MPHFYSLTVTPWIDHHQRSLLPVCSMRIYIVKEKLADIELHVSAALKEFFPVERAPATTWIGVYALANSDFLIEIEAIGSIE